MTNTGIQARPRLSHVSLEPAPVLAIRPETIKPGAGSGFEGIGGGFYKNLEPGIFNDAEPSP
jgi:hypothetical protein